MTWRSLAIGSAFAVGSAACMLVLSPAELDSAWGTSDASSEASADGGDGGEPASLLKNGDFELGCDVSWVGYHATLSDDALAHTGKKSCRVCYVPGSLDTQFGLKPILNSVSSIKGAAVQPNVKYRLEAWIRSTTDAPSPSSAFVLMSFGDVGYNPILTGTAKEAPLTGTWTAFHTDVLSTDPGVATLIPEVGSLEGADAGACILVDDVRVSVVP